MKWFAVWNLLKKNGGWSWKVDGAEMKQDWPRVDNY